MISLRTPLSIPTYKQKNIVPVRKVVNPRVLVKPCNFSPDVMDSVNMSVYYIGKGIILFSLFYCSMNWVYYRGVRKDYEKYAEKKREEMKKQKEAKERLAPPRKEYKEVDMDNFDKFN